MILNEANLRLEFDRIFDDSACNPNFESESQNTKDWAFRTWVSASDLGLLFVRIMNDRLFKSYEDCEDFSFAPSFEFVSGIDYSLIKFGGVIVWSENNGALDEEETINCVMERVRKILAFCGEQKLEELFQ